MTSTCAGAGPRGSPDGGGGGDEKGRHFQSYIYIYTHVFIYIYTSAGGLQMAMPSRLGASRPRARMPAGERGEWYSYERRPDAHGSPPQAAVAM